MEIKSKNNKTRNTKNIIACPNIPAKVTADIVGCSESTVKKVRINYRTDQSIIGQKVKLVEELYNEGNSTLIAEIKRIVNI